MTPSEVLAMEALRTKCLKPGWGRSPWSNEQDFPPLSADVYRSSAGLRVQIKAPIETVQSFLSKKLKPGRTLLSVVRFSDGRMEEIRNPRPSDAGITIQEKPPLIPSPKPVVAVTVAKPVIGCPPPNFPAAELRANRVLESFLDSGQKEDFRQRNQFISVGADTGQRYLITSRLRRDGLGSVGGRSLFCLDEGHPFCVHDWSVPAAEEMLGLHLFLSLPGWEMYLRGIPG